MAHIIARTSQFGKLTAFQDYNCVLSTWEVSRQVVKHIFARHDFSMTWGYGEFDASTNLAPSYYDNVQYAELADFFYVWLKRSVGHLFPEFFSDELTNKDDEAVANPARFAALGRKKKQLAERDYERKMAAAFREMHRVLHPDGVLTVMFTHKRVEAWDTLATALIGAGFAIHASWPVHTESDHSLHQAKKNAAASTILLVCRKRTPTLDPSPARGGWVGEGVWWDDLQGRVRRVAREKAREYAAQGIGGVDLYISTFGPTLSVISERWPVLTSEIDERTGQPKPLRPDTALDLAREEVIRLRKEGLLAGKAIAFDPVTDTLPVRGWYDLREPALTPIRTLAQLRQAVAALPVQASLADSRAEDAQRAFAQQAQAITGAHRERLQRYSHQHDATLRAWARRLLEKAALVEVAIGQQRTLFDEENYPTSFSEAAVTGLKRHKSPWTWMLYICGKPLPKPKDTDPFYDPIRNADREKLRALFDQLTEQAREVLRAWQAAHP